VPFRVWPTFPPTRGRAHASRCRLPNAARPDADLNVLARITESFSKATEQLGNDKVEVRLGGIYTLERISRESSDDYWTVMETLCAFVRERARRSEPETTSSETVEPPTDIAAVLAVTVRRDEKNQRRESEKGWRLNFHGTDLSGANLSGAKLHGAKLHGANLVGANLSAEQLAEAISDAETRLPSGRARPAHWPAPDAAAPPAGTA
jgi:hypothetical protein